MVLLCLAVAVCSQIFPATPLGVVEPPKVDFFEDQPTATLIPIVWNTPAHARFVDDPGVYDIYNEYHQVVTVLGDALKVTIEVYDEWGTVVMDPMLGGTVTAIAGAGVLESATADYTVNGFVFDGLKFTSHPYFAGPWPTHDHVLDEISFRFDFTTPTRLNGMLLHARTVYVYPRSAHRIQFSLTNPPAWPGLLRGPGTASYPDVQLELVDSLGNLDMSLVGVVAEAVIIEDTVENVVVRHGTGRVVVQDGVAVFRNIIIDFETPKGSVVTTRLVFNVSGHALGANEQPPLTTPGFDIFNYDNPLHTSIRLSDATRRMYTANAVFYYNQTLPLLEVEVLDPMGDVDTTLQNLAIALYPHPANTTFEGLTRRVPIVAGKAIFNDIRVTSHGAVQFTFKLELITTPSPLPLPLTQVVGSEGFIIVASGGYRLQLVKVGFPVTGVVLGHPIPLIKTQMLKSDGTVDEAAQGVAVEACSDSGVLSDICRTQLTDDTGVASFNELTFSVLPEKRPNDTDGTPPTPLITFTATTPRGVLSTSTAVEFTNKLSTPNEVMAHAGCVIPTPNIGDYPFPWTPLGGQGVVIGEVPFEGGCTQSVVGCLKTELVRYDGEVQSLEGVYYVNDSTHLTVKGLNNAEEYTLTGLNDTGWVRMWLWCRERVVPECVMFPLVIGGGATTWFRESPPFDVPLRMQGLEVPLHAAYDDATEVLTPHPFNLTLTDSLNRRWMEWELIEWVCKRYIVLEYDMQLSVGEEDIRLQRLYEECVRGGIEVEAILKAPEGVLSNNIVTVRDGVAAYGGFSSKRWRGEFTAEFRLISNGWVAGNDEMFSSWEEGSSTQWIQGFGTDPPISFITPWQPSTYPITFTDDTSTTTPTPTQPPTSSHTVFWHVQTSPTGWTGTSIKIGLAVLVISCTVAFHPSVMVAVVLETSALCTSHPSPASSTDIVDAMRWILTVGKILPTAIILGGCVVGGGIGIVVLGKKSICTRIIVTALIPLVRTGVRDAWGDWVAFGVSVVCGCGGVGVVLWHGEGYIPVVKLGVYICVAVLGVIPNTTIPTALLATLKAMELLLIVVLRPHKVFYQNVFTAVNTICHIVIIAGLLDAATGVTLVQVGGLGSLGVIVMNVLTVLCLDIKERWREQKPPEESEESEDDVVVTTQLPPSPPV